MNKTELSEGINNQLNDASRIFLNEEQENKEVSNVSVSDLLKQREAIEDKIRSIDPMALINYELEQLQITPEPKEEPVPVSVEEAAKSFAKKSFDLMEDDIRGLNRKPTSFVIESVNNWAELDFIAGANYQKEQHESSLNKRFDEGYTSGSNATAERFHYIILQDKELIRELLEALKSVKTLNLHLYDEGTVGNMVKIAVESAINKANNYLNQ